MPSSPDGFGRPEGRPLHSEGRPLHRAPVVGSFLEGCRRVLRAPLLTAAIFGLTFVLALPLAIALRSQLTEHLGASFEGERARWGWNAEWATEFAGSSSGIGRTFTYEILGFGGTLAVLSGFVDRAPLDPTIAGAVAAYIAMWMFLSGGILDRLARGRPIRLSAFFAACGEYFVRFLRLGVVIGFAYWALFRWLHPLLFGTLYDRLTGDLTVEYQAFVIRAALYASFLGALAIINVIADFTKVRAVVEDRRSMIAAIGAAVRFIRRRFWRVTALYLLNIVFALVIARLWLQMAQPAWSAEWLAFLAAQIYLVGRVFAKLAFMASEVVFFQGELAHARYTAAPEPIWPDSPAVEAIKTSPRSNT